MSRAERRRQRWLKRPGLQAPEREAWQRMDKRSQHRALMLLAEKYVHAAAMMEVDRVVIELNDDALVLELRPISDEEAERFFAPAQREKHSHMLRALEEKHSDQLRQPEDKNAD
jgi:hypothetical protein